MMPNLAQQKFLTSLSVYTVALIVVLAYSINEISAENDVHSLQDHSLNTFLDESEDRFARSIKATPLRWGKRSIEKRSTAEDDDGTSDEVVHYRDTRATPLRYAINSTFIFTQCRSLHL